jgi:hypothetical protein
LALYVGQRKVPKHVVALYVINSILNLYDHIVVLDKYIHSNPV